MVSEAELFFGRVAGNADSQINHEAPLEEFAQVDIRQVVCRPASAATRPIVVFSVLRKRYIEEHFS